MPLKCTTLIKLSFSVKTWQFNFPCVSLVYDHFAESSIVIFLSVTCRIYVNEEEITTKLSVVIWYQHTKSPNDYYHVRFCTESGQRFYKHSVRNQVKYNSIIWSPQYKAHSHTIERVLNKLLIFLNYTCVRTHTIYTDTNSLTHLPSTIILWGSSAINLFFCCKIKGLSKNSDSHFFFQDSRLQWFDNFKNSGHEKPSNMLSS